ncbi:hypothetical protein ACFY0G_20150 [Streptomyces sp. NPDC001552]|uniref:hypothetical protein n=1 Tax=Streptomyces sp. NPDC001552 TaxID=3364587 RepID=UPI00369F7E95
MTQRTETATPPKWATGAGYAACLAPLIGFVPLHALWAFGVPVWAYEEKFDAWYADGGGPYLGLLCVLALLGSALAVALVHPCGHRVPRWVPVLAGRPVPRELVLWPAVAGSALLAVYGLWGTGLALYFLFADRDDLVFDAWAGAGTMAVILAWVAGLVPATWSYHARTAPKRHRTGRPSA